MLTETDISKLDFKETAGESIHIKDKDPQKIASRQLTNFIKNVPCEELSDANGELAFKFSNREVLKAALSLFCSPPIPDKEQIASMFKRFTIISTNRMYSLYSVKRLLPKHFNMFGSGKVHNNFVINFPDKISMCKVLRDANVEQIYPCLFINSKIISVNELMV